MIKDLYVIILNDGDQSYAVPVGEGLSTRKEALERVDYWNSLEGFTARLGLATPIDH